MTNPAPLPPLPEPDYWSTRDDDTPLFTTDQMRSYARAAVAAAHAQQPLDCRTCRHHTTASGGCVSVLRCIDGSAYQQAGVRQCWERGIPAPTPKEPTP